MSAQSEPRSGAANAEAGDLVDLATDPKAFDRKIAEIVAARESAHDRERRALAAEAKLEASEKALAAASEALARDLAQAKRGLDEREAAVAAKEGELERREAKVAEFNRMIQAA